ncbi:MULTISPECIES: dipeptidase [unclassified Streptomyces]|uniref:dipeptidase n=1 Tax=unclassified Streptomyces TaxID=2593676 RepID=UPI002E195394|nr:MULTISPECIES: membrane dipeptidase [unclassified Streptomyces]
MADLQDELTAPAEAGDLEAARPTTADLARPTPAGHVPADAGNAPPTPGDPTSAAPTPTPAGHVPADAGNTDNAPTPADPTPADPTPASPTPAALTPPHDLLTRHPVADGYCGLPQVLRALPWYDLELGESAVEADLPRLRAGGTGAQLWAPHVAPDAPLATTLEQIDLITNVVARHPEDLRLSRSASDTADARAHGRIAVLIGPAPAMSAADSLGTLRSLHALGLRALTLSGTSWASDAGLTRFGEEVVREMNRLGMLIDLTGASAATAARVLAVSKAPVALTRSGAHALNHHPDNASDDLLAALGDSRGLCLVPCSADRTGPALRDVADHVDHVRRLAGPEAVGLSGTYDTGEARPEDLTDVAGYPALIAELQDRGWTDADLALLTWGNVQRVLRSTEFVSRAAQQRRGPSTATHEP